jgi:hypothetical protein
MNRERAIWLELTKDEANELFSRCLKSLDEDNDLSRSILQKLADVLDKDHSGRAPQVA